MSRLKPITEEIIKTIVNNPEASTAWVANQCGVKTARVYSVKYAQKKE